MIEPGILDGDMAIVEKCDYAEDGSAGTDLSPDGRAPPQSGLFGRP